MNKVQANCPICHKALKIRELHCDECDLSLKGEFAQSLFYDLSQDEQQFVFDFVLNSGSLKSMAEKLNKSYPTVRNILDNLIEKLKASQMTEKKLGSKKTVLLDLVEEGQISISAAHKIIDLLRL